MRAGLEVGLRVHRVWHGALGSPLADELRPSHVEEGCLVVVTRSSVWLSEARFLEARILDALRQADPGLGFTRVKVKMDRSPTAAAGPRKTAPVPERPLGPEEAARIRALAASVKDPVLQKGLERLFTRVAARRTPGAS